MSCTVRARIVRLDTSVPAHQALKQVIAMKAGRCSGMNWRRLPGRHRKTWIQQIGDGTTTSWKQMWQLECRGAWTSWRVVATDHSRPVAYTRNDDDDDDDDDDDGTTERNKTHFLRRCWQATSTVRRPMWSDKLLVSMTSNLTSGVRRNWHRWNASHDHSVTVTCNVNIDSTLF